jgi:uncharacterized protein YndB with AHSA1/START domain
MITTEKKLVLEKSIELKADVSKVWDALTNPEVIKQYFFGTEAVSDWKEGSPLYFKGVWEGKEYMDKGTILKLESGKLLHYNYWSSFSGTKDVPENYANITYKLSSGKGVTILTIIQDNIETEESRQHSDQNWGMVLEGLRKIVEG